MRIHLIGIGGIGISALAKFLYFENHTISGSDRVGNTITRDLEKIGITIYTPHSRDAIDDDIDIVIYSAIIQNDNIEIVEAKLRGIPTLSRNEAIKWILKDRKVFSVCGAHGKSTTSSILATILQKSYIIGAYNKIDKSNTKYIDGDEVVFEADESDGSFLNSNPTYSIVPNAEPEHMEFYNYDLEKFYSAYYNFLKQGKRRVINSEDPFLSKLDLEAIRLYPSKDIRDIQFTIIEREPYTRFTLKNYGTFQVWGIGEHIAIDASLAILTAIDYGMEIEEIRNNLLRYRGIEKRFDILQKKRDFILIDDYGHHPTEIEATLKSLFQYSKMVGIDEVVAIWQPHKYSRTIDNLEGFKSCFKGVTKLVILPVWSAGEEKREIDFQSEFRDYSPIFANRVFVEDGKMKIPNGMEILKGIIIGFGAGDITYQLRGKI